jgi:DNA-binding beta-propeller fold protein YncE
LKEKKIVLILSIIILIGISLLLSFVFVYQNFNYVYAFKPSNAPTDTTETITPSDTTESYQFIKAWGSNGTGDGEFGMPTNIAVDSSSGYVYVADNALDRIQKFDSNGNFITKWGSNGNGTAQFDGPQGLSVDSKGNVYVADSRFSPLGSMPKTSKAAMSAALGMIPMLGPIMPSIINEEYFNILEFIGNDRIQKFDSNGNFITKWGSNGTGDGKFNYPKDIAVGSSSGYVYVADTDNNRIQKFDSNGNFITKWGSNGNGTAQFDGPQGLSVDSKGYIYVADTRNDRIQKFDSNGNFITKWGSYVNSTGDGEFNYPQDVSVDSSSGYVYVADTDNNRIQVFAPIA